MCKANAILKSSMKWSYWGKRFCPFLNEFLSDNFERKNFILRIDLKTLVRPLGDLVALSESLLMIETFDPDNKLSLLLPPLFLGVTSDAVRNRGRRLQNNDTWSLTLTPTKFRSQIRKSFARFWEICRIVARLEAWAKQAAGARAFHSPVRRCRPRPPLIS